MQIYTESIRGYPYMHKDQLAREFNISKATVHNRMQEIQKEVTAGRYNDYAIIQDGKLVLINVLVFVDYLKYRRMLQDKNARKSVPEFHPEKLVQIMGWSNRTVLENET